MNKEAQRIAIAEACGWKLLRWERHGDFFSGWKSPEGKQAQLLPDYLNNLNAMHEAEKTLSADPDNGFVNRGYNNQKTRFLYALESILGDAFPIHATAAQRAKAFLITLNLWKDCT